MVRYEAGVVLGGRAVTPNRLGYGTGRGGFIALVGQLVDAIDRRDRWAIARRATGPLLDELLSGEYNEHFGLPTTLAEPLGLDGAPVVLVDDGLAIVTAPVMRRHVGVVGAVSALLVQAEGDNGPWFAASLTQDTLWTVRFEGGFSTRRSRSTPTSRSSLRTVLSMLAHHPSIGTTTR